MLEKYEFVNHYNLVPYKELPQLLSNTDLHILFQKNDVIDTVMPSKLLGMMASSKPSIVTGNKMSEFAKVFGESKCGYFLDGNSVDEVIQQVVNLQSDIDLSRELGANGYEYVIDKFSKKKVLNGFVYQLEQL